ncbi:MAG: FAD-binding oxidoreductase [Pyrinomonadaceae bacterium]
MPHKIVTNWGNFPSVEANITESASIPEIQNFVIDQKSLIARGNGRCYGDSSLNANIFSTLKLNKFLSFDANENTIECESGVLLCDILDVIVPKGFFLPVTPGTKFITLGGAIAADVHGKNHHREGSFAEHVVEIKLMAADLEIHKCSPTEDADLFWQTCGGMGLTGIILSAKFKLKLIETSYIRQVSEKADDIEKVMRLFDESGDHSYSVAWLDCFAGKRHRGRSILRLGEHMRLDDLPDRIKKDHLLPAAKKGMRLPFYFPAFSLNYATVKTFNFLYYHKQMTQRAVSIDHFDGYFYPLDGIRNWNRAYGKPGFVQYQFVLPKADSYDGLVETLAKIERSGQGSPLAVLKLFGKPNQNAVMSFPLEGYTLALDFKVNPEVFRLLDELDEIVLKHNGRIYLAKDARMSSEVFHNSYSNIVASGRFESAQSKRLGF